MINPFIEKHNPDSTDKLLVESALDGSRQALEELILRHQAWIYNIALRMVWSPQDAEDVTQEVLIKIITKLSTFKGRSAFRTWAYRIAANHVINMKKRHSEQDVTNFECYGIALDEIPEMSLSDKDCRPVDMQILVEEAKISCMTAMLLCLDREQRLIYILRDIFKISYSIGSRILEISEENFRQKLSRTRKKLYSFMNDKCSLINGNNPCRCVRKTKGFIRSGIVDPYKLKFNDNYLKKVKDVSEERSRELDSLIDSGYASLFREHPFQNPPDFVKNLHDILHSKELRNIFDFIN